MSGLEIAAGAASVVGGCNLIVSKLLPFIRDTVNVDANVKRFYHDICEFKNVLVVVESNFGARTDFKLQRSFDQTNSLAMKNHVYQCKATIEEIERELPDAHKDRSIGEKVQTNLYLLLGSDVIKKLRQDIPPLKATLQLWLQVLQLDGIRTQQSGQQYVEASIGDLNRKMDNLRNALEERDGILRESEIHLDKDDTIRRSGKECLESASTIRETSYSSYQPTSTSTSVCPPRRDQVLEWNKDVARKLSAELARTRGLDRASSTNETSPSGNGDSGYESDQMVKSPATADNQKDYLYPANRLTDLINKSRNNAQQWRELGEYERAVSAQEQAIKWGRERERNHKVEFKEERDMLRRLAKIRLEQGKPFESRDILVKTLKGAEPGSPDTWALNHELAEVYFVLGMYEPAARHANGSVNGQQSSLEVGDNRTIATLTLLWKIHDKMGNQTEATVFRMEALKHKINQDGPSDEAMLQVLQDEPTDQKVHQLLEELEDVDIQDILALKTFQWAVALGEYEIVTSLWNSYETVVVNIDAENGCGMPPLISAAAFGHEEMAEFLLSCGADVNVRASSDFSNDTALMLAAEKQCISMVKQLLAKGAGVCDSNKHGRNALHRAQGRPVDSDDTTRKEIVKRLLEKDREGLINARCAADKTPLHLASEFGNTPLMELLLSLGADIEARDCGQRTPLILAVDSGWPKAVKLLLLEWGAEHEVEDLMGRTPRRIARKGLGGAREIQMLLDHAKKNPRTRRRATVSKTSPRSPRHHNASMVSLTQTPTQRSSTAILSPTATAPSVFSSPYSDELKRSLPSTLRLPYHTPSIASTASPGMTARRRPWSIWSKMDKVGKDSQ